jgi:hypothetical protein
MFTVPLVDVNYASDVVVIPAWGKGDGITTAEYYAKLDKIFRFYPPKDATISDEAVKRAWIMYSAIAQQPKLTKVADKYVVTTADQWRWWLRCQLVKWRLI